jgi:membrane protein DedA with SNARE-associated domain
MGSLTAALDQFLTTYGLLAIFIVMLLKEAGIPVPIPSDIIMLTAGVQAATGAYTLVQLLGAIIVAVLIGGSIQFLVARSAGRQFIYRVGRLVGLTPERLDRAMALLQRRGTMAVFLGLNIPGARAGIIPAAGVAKLSYPRFTPAMVAGSGVFYGWHIALGYIVGPSAESILKGIPIVPILVVLSLIGLAGWLFLRYRRRQKESLIDSLHSWTNAACPACLAITLIQQTRQPEPPGEGTG